MSDIFLDAELFRISYMHQAQPTRWDCRTRVRFAGALHDRSKLIKVHTILPYEQQRSDDSANHAGQKGIRSKITVDQSTEAGTTRIQHSTYTVMRPRLSRIGL